MNNALPKENYLCTNGHIFTLCLVSCIVYKLYLRNSKYDKSPVTSNKDELDEDSEYDEDTDKVLGAAEIIHMIIDNELW